MKTQNQRISIQQSMIPPQLRAKKSPHYRPPLILTPQMLQNQNNALTPMNKLSINNNSMFEKLGFEDSESIRQNVQNKSKNKTNNRYNQLDHQNNSEKYRYESADDYADHVNEDYRLTFNKQSKKTGNNFLHIIPKKRNTQGNNNIQVSKSNNQLKYNKSVTLKKPNNFNNQYMINSQLMLRDHLPPLNKFPQYLPITNSILPSLYLNNSQYQSAYQPMYQGINYKNKPMSSIQLHKRKQSIQQIVKDLQNHNKNIMKETKKTVTDYQTYIQQLLQSNAELQSNLLQYQNYIQTLQNEKQQIIINSKQRQTYLQKIVKQKIYVQKQLKKQRQNKSQSPPSIQININQDNKRKQQQICNLKEQLNMKQENIKLFQQLIAQKQGIIKNMANFNNQMCLEIMELKKNIIWGENNKNNYNNNNEITQIKYKNQENQYNNKIKNKLQTKLAELLQENESLKATNYQLQKQLKQFLKDDEIIVVHMQKQAKKISLLQKKIQILTNNLKKSKQHFQKQDKSQISCSIDLQKGQDYQNSIKKGQIYKNGKKLIVNYENNERKQSQELQKTQNLNKLQARSSIQKIDIQYNNYLNNQQGLQQSHDEILLKKINNVLQIVYKNLQDHGKKQKYKETILNIMRTLTQINDQTTQLDLQNESRGSMLKSNQYNLQNSNFLNNLQGNDRNKIHLKKSSSQGCKIESSDAMNNILQKNSQILSKIRQIKQKVKKHTNQIQTDRSNKQSQDTSSKLQYLNYIESNINENEEVYYGNFQKQKKQSTMKQQRNQNIYQILEQLDKLNIKNIKKKSRK